MKKSLIVMLMLSLIFVFAACGNEDATGETDDGTRIIQSSTGEEITIPSDVERIVAGAPSIVEIMVGLGQEDKLVAVDNYSTDVEGLPEGMTTFDTLSPDIEMLLTLDPDVLITSGMSLISGGDNPYQALIDQGVTVILTDNAVSLEGIQNDIVFIADICGVKEDGETMAADLASEIENYRAIGETITDTKTVYFEIDCEPSLYSLGSGNFINEIIELVGAENIFADQEGWITPNAEAVITAAPDVIITNADYREDPVGAIMERAGWSTIPAIANQEVYLVGANATSRPTQNIINGIDEIAKAIYPEYYN